MMGQDVRTALPALAEQAGVSLAALSRMLGRNDAYLQQFVHRGSPRTLAEGDRRQLAEFFGVPETRLGAPKEAGPLLMPRLAVAASAGPGATVDDDVMIGVEALDRQLARRLGLSDGTASVIRVRGDSMAPGLMDGDHLVVDQKDTRPGARGGLYIIRIGDALMVKRVCATPQGLVATSDNPAAPPVPDGPIMVVGRVVWQMRLPA
ncbi:S24 family peptidase [Sphingomonas pseudosanguinis]|uniref:Phage repressor protein C with HTH and peptisase S24 domain n=1 Tax=Sphingomonas pseudosanguinis TaxID=413712 RepID=A0A7W6ADR9_9SPHN|nr:LexA family transcriptional regulator [Sphingomonas pseudosanguinis]MBB3880058.1 phage repressor protein C with HTH and peptisase S24 domain [Sphingomonas pseudosanguinis]MBN3536783.1 LexA family transcriptional regulator [Sphingomonas pseudosanguinis]